jgi:hypothetical protein
MRLEGVTLSFAADQTRRKLLIRSVPPTGPGIQVVAAFRPANAGRMWSAAMAADVSSTQAPKHPIRALERAPTMTRR